MVRPEAMRLAPATRASRSLAHVGTAKVTGEACVVFEADSRSQRSLRRRQELCWQNLRRHVR
jgi:hypothetical protein